MLETELSMLRAAVVALTQTLEGMKNGVTLAAATPAVVPATPAPTPAPLPVATPAPLVIPTLIPQPAAAAMPPPPTFAMPAAAPGALPFTDSASLVSYVMGVYKAIGPAKGAGIQNVLTSLGVVNLTDVKPEHYAQFYAGIEALKAS